MQNIDTITLKEAKDLGIVNAEGLGYIKPQSAFRNITENLLSKLKKGDLVWRKPWRNGMVVNGKTYGPQNYETQRPYSGGNAFFIHLQNILNQTDYNFFLTQKQILKHGGTLKKGATPFPVSVYIENVKTKTVKRGGENIDVEFEERGVIWYHVYPIDLVDNLKLIERKQLKADTFNEIIVTDAENIIKYMPKAPPISNGGNKAFYSPSIDKVQMPIKKSFKIQQQYYSVLFHELIHSTGSVKRLNRDLTGKFGSKLYAAEELIAEIGAAFICGVCEIDYFTLNNSAAYLKSWANKVTEEIKEDSNFLKRVVFKAVKAATFIIGKTLDKHGKVVNETEKANHYPGKEIVPNKKAKASITIAINELMNVNKKFKDIGAMALGVFYSKFKSLEIGNKVEVKEGLLEKLFDKLNHFDLVSYNERIDTEAELTEFGKEVIEKINARLQTLKAKKSGTDLFPELSGTKSVSLDFIKRYVDLDGKVLTQNQLLSFIQELQYNIRKKQIRKSDPYAKIITVIQKRLVVTYNKMGDSILIIIKDVEKFKNPEGLGFLPMLIAAAAGKGVELLTQKVLKKDAIAKEPVKETLSGGIISVAQLSATKYDVLKLNPYYKKIFGSPATNFDMCLHGEPGAGKTVFLLKAANYFATNFGKTLFVTTEEFGSATLIKKVKDFNITSSNLFFAPKLTDVNISDYKVIFLDSVNHSGLTLDDYKELRIKYPNTAFVLVLQTTKGGTFKGGKDWPHEVEICMRLYRDKLTGVRYAEVTKDRYTELREVKL